jgi:flagellar basal-body rod protein FlgF
MDKGLYSATSGGMLATKRIDVVANNIANVNTVGFKGERLASRQQEFRDTLASQVGGDTTLAKKDFDRTPGVVATGTTTDFTVGPIQYTGNPLDIALRKPNQFFSVTTPEGELLTRAGNFTLTADGTLVTQDGQPVNGDGGAIQIPAGPPPKITPNGTITVGGRNLARVRVVEVADLTQLERIGSSRFKLKGGEPNPAEIPSIAVESVEMPNVQVVEGMVDMINAHKAFEAYTKTARTIEELNERAVRTARTQG